MWDILNRIGRFFSAKSQKVVDIYRVEEYYLK